MDDEQQKNQQNQKILHSDIFKWLIIGVVCFILIILALGVGIKIGAEKARFSYQWADNYHKNFGGPRAGFIANWREFPAGDFIEAHGSFGKIINIDGNTIIIQGRENVEKTILIKEDTIIKGIKGDLKTTDLKVDDFITVIGSPNDSGQIEAKLIRVLPPPLSIFPPRNFNN